MKKLFVSGASGRMGKFLVDLSEAHDFKVVGTLNRSGIDGFDDFDVIVDFSLPEAFSAALNLSLEKEKPFVSGTTGLTDKQMEDLVTASKKIPVLWASNMSLGITFMNHMLSQYSSIKDNFDFQIEEFHHIHKKDKPSGTAITLQESLVKAVDKTVDEPLAIRGGGIYGVHKVWAMSEEETISLEHTALNRSVFAKGALSACRWIVNKPIGRYSMKDVLSLGN